MATLNRATKQTPMSPLAVDAVVGYAGRISRICRGLDAAHIAGFGLTKRQSPGTTCRPSQSKTPSLTA
jgi:hypothetical protein